MQLNDSACDNNSKKAQVQRMNEKWLTLRTVEQITGLTRQTLYRRLKDGRLKGLKLDNNTWRITEKEIEKLFLHPDTK